MRVCIFYMHKHRARPSNQRLCRLRRRGHRVMGPCLLRVVRNSIHYVLKHCCRMSLSGLCAAAAPWRKIEKKHCNHNKHAIPYSTLKAAEDACVQKGSSCAGVYDGGCNNRGAFYLCKVGTFRTSSSSCVYKPPGMLIGRMLYLPHGCACGRPCGEDSVVHG